MTNIVRIHDRAFREVGITGDFTYLRYTEEFRGAGECELRLPYGSPAVSLIEPDGYITVPDGIMYRVLSVTRNFRDGYVSVQCAGLLSLFSGTAIPEEYGLTGEASALMYSIVRQGAGNLPVALTLGDVNGGGTVRISSGRSYLYDDLVSLCYLGNIGMSMEHNGEKLVFSAVLPKDRTEGSDDPVLVCRKMGTFEAESFLWDFSSYKNVAVVSGAEKESGGRYTVTVRGDSVDFSDSFPDGNYFDRQLLVNYTSPVRPYMEENAEGLLELDEEAYLAALTASGAAALGRCRPRLRFTGRTDGEVSHIKVGDTVTLGDGETDMWGTATAETVETVYSHEGRRVSCTLTADLSPEVSA